MAVFVVFVIVSAPVAWALTAWPGYGTFLNCMWGVVIVGICGSMALAVHKDHARTL